jgi:alkylhydroperoxidase family enzyme
MPIIQTVEPEEATGLLAKLYKKITLMRGHIGNNAKLFSSCPELLRQQMDFIQHYTQHPTLSLPLLAAIRVMVSAGESCDYCVDYNTAMLTNMAGWTPEQVAAMRGDTDASPLAAKERALLKTVVKAIRNAHGVTADDLDVLREAGWSDTDIFDAVHHGARMLATDILFNTFKIEKEF